MPIAPAFLNPLVLVRLSHPLHSQRTPHHSRRLSITQPCRPRRLHQPHRPHGGLHDTTPLATATPASDATPKPPPPLTEGTLVEIATSSSRRLARLVSPDGKRNWIAADASGQTFSVPRKQITFVLGHPDASPLLREPLDSLRIDAQARAAQCQELLEIAWEIFSDDSSLQTTVPDIAQVLMHDQSPLALFATHLLLSDDILYFKPRFVKGVQLYQPKTQAQVHETRLFLDAQELQQKRLQQNRDKLLAAYSAADLPAFRAALESDADDVMATLDAMALELEASPNSDSRYGSSTRSVFRNLSKTLKPVVQDVFSTLSLPVAPSSAFHILVVLGVFTRHQNLALRNPDLPTWSSSPRAEAAIPELLAGSVEDLDAHIRVDLTHLLTIAIDSADTSEVDDAFSWDAASQTIYVHIADPSRFFPTGLDHPVLQEALQRVSTLYLPDTKFTMFPEEVATRLMSLTGDLSDGSALSFSFKLDGEGALEPAATTVQLSTIRKPVRLTYGEAEAVLQDEGREHHDTLARLLGEMERRREWREIEGGAILVGGCLSDVSVRKAESEEPEVSIGLISTSSASWMLVSELMITTCVIAAQVAVREGLAVGFRGQERFDYPDDEVLESVPDGVVRAQVAFRNAGPSEVSLEAREHASLGLDAYVQVTSPIRRSLDLIAHMQLKGWLRGGGGMVSEETVGMEIGRTASTGRAVRTTENRTKWYWQMEYLRRMVGKERMRGTFLRETKKGMGMTHLDELGFTVLVEVGGKCRLGDEMEVEIVAVDARAGVMRARGRRKGKTGEGEAEDRELDKEFEAVLREISDVSEVNSDLDSES